MKGCIWWRLHLVSNWSRFSVEFSFEKDASFPFSSHTALTAHNNFWRFLASSLNQVLSGVKKKNNKIKKLFACQEVDAIWKMTKSELIQHQLWGPPWIRGVGLYTFFWATAIDKTPLTHVFSSRCLSLIVSRWRNELFQVTWLIFHNILAIN